MGEILATHADLPCPRNRSWLQADNDDGKHDISMGLRENYRKRWKTAINAVRASTKFRTFAAMAADGRAASSSSNLSSTSGVVSADSAGKTAADGEKGKTEGKADGESRPTRSELYSEDEDEDEDESGWQTPEDEHDEGAEEKSQRRSHHGSKDSSGGGLREKVNDLGEKLQKAL